MVSAEGNKRCPDCEQYRPTAKFSRCSSTQDGYQTYCKACISVRKKASSKILKEEVFAAYGGKCECPHCDVAQLDFLTIDHINGDGAASKRNGEGSGTSLWLYLKRNGYPKGRHRVLCYNCNCARRFGACPHERLSLEAVAAMHSLQLCFDF